jgi:hypothetical protein
MDCLSSEDLKEERTGFGSAYQHRRNPGFVKWRSLSLSCVRSLSLRQGRKPKRAGGGKTRDSSPCWPEVAQQAN